MIKKAVALVMTLVFALSLFTVNVSADSSILLIVDDVMIETDVAPQNVNGRILVPLRILAEMTNCKVEWDGENQCAIVYAPSGDEPYLFMYIGNTEVLIQQYSGETGEYTHDYATLDVPPMIINGRTMVPVRFVCENLGYAVEWDALEQAVYMYSPWYDYGDGYDDEEY